MKVIKVHEVKDTKSKEDESSKKKELLIVLRSLYSAESLNKLRETLTSFLC